LSRDGPDRGARPIASTRSTQKPTPASGGFSSRDRGARERGQSWRRRRSCPDAALPGCSSVTPPTVSEHATSLESQLLIRARFFILIPVIRAHLVSSADRFTGARHDHEGQVPQQWRHLSSPVTGLRTHTEQNQGMPTSFLIDRGRPISVGTLRADHQGITDRPQFAAAKGGVLDRRRNACRRKGRLGEPTAASSGPSLKPPALPGDTYRIIFWKNGSGSPGWTPQLYSPVTNTKPSASRFAGRPVEAGR